MIEKDTLSTYKIYLYLTLEVITNPGIKITLLFK